MPIDLTAAADVAALPFGSACEQPLEGATRSVPEDFRVDEVAAYEPSGEGDHLYVRFEKTSLDTREAVARLATALGADPRQAGYAGMKDRHAITRQWASFLFGDAARLSGVELEGITILEMARHPNKLRTGHLRANRFDLLVRGAPEAQLDAVRGQLAELERRGVPNYFGGQRFGRGGQNLVDASRWLLDGGRAPRQPFQRKLLVSTLQSAMFNELLAARVSEGSLDGAIEGDLMRKEDTGGHFVSEDAEADRARVRAFAISPTGPMYGSKMSWPAGEALVREEATLARWGLDRGRLDGFRKAGLGTRRPYRIPLAEAEASLDPAGIRLRFTLPSGAYATVVLRELMRVDVR